VGEGERREELEGCRGEGRGGGGGRGRSVWCVGKVGVGIGVRGGGEGGEGGGGGFGCGIPVFGFGGEFSSFPCPGEGGVEVRKKRRRVPDRGRNGHDAGSASGERKNRGHREGTFKRETKPENRNGNHSVRDKGLVFQPKRCP